MVRAPMQRGAGREARVKYSLDVARPGYRERARLGCGGVWAVAERMQGREWVGMGADWAEEMVL